MTTTISSKFQIVIPKKIRESLKLNSGMKLEILPFDGNIALIPIYPINNLKGSLKGINTSIIREKDRQF